MAIKLFSDAQKNALANESGVTGATADSFNRDINPDTGEATMYMKLGNNQKFYGKNPVRATPTPIESQAIAMQNTMGQKPYNDSYAAIMSAVPDSRARIQQDVDVKYNFQDQFQSLSQQKAELLKSMTGDQSAIFGARNPDGTPVDPRVAVAQYQANMSTTGARLKQLDELETTYRAQAKVLGDVEYDKQQKNAEMAKTAMLYMKDLQDQEYRNKQLEQNQSQFEASQKQNQGQFEETKNLQYAQLGKPELKQNADGGWDWLTPPASGASSGELASATFSSPSQQNKKVSLDKSALEGFT